MNMKRARFWRNLLLFSALSSTASLSQAQEGVSRVGPGAASQTPGAPGAAVLSAPEGFVPLTPSPYMPLGSGYDFQRPMPPSLPPAQDTLRNSRQFGPRFDIGQFLGDRMGVGDNDTNFNFLLPYLLGSGEEVLFIDARGLVTDQGRGGASAGLGYRSFSPTYNRIFGLSGWVDYDNGHARDYRQAGVSFESLGAWMDFRINGYIPFGNETNVVGSTIVGDPFFSGSGLLVNQRVLTESAYRGFDAEIGGPLPLLGRYGVSGYVGGYWMDSKTDETAAGPRVRVEANVTDNFRVDMLASDDKVFGTSAWVNLNFSLPDGRARKWFRPVEVEDRMLRTVNRSYRVQTNTRADLVPTPVLVVPPGTPNNPQGGSGTPVTVIFVDPDRATNGDGTFERPFNTLIGFANTSATTLVIVDGSPTDRPVNGTISLFDDQKLLSTSIITAGGVQLNTNLGLITLPSLTGFGDATPVSPIFTNPAGGTLVTLAGSNIEVAGFTFDGSTANASIPNAIGISGTNIVDFNIHHNTFRSYRNAVVLNNATGLGLFQANTLTGTPGVSLDGFRLANSGTGTLDLFVDSFVPPVGSTLSQQGNIISGNDGAGVSITARNRAVINAHVVDNTITNNGNGIVIDAAATRSVINASIANNIIDGNRGEDRNLNGILDPGEDLNGDGVLNAGNGVLLSANASTINMAQLGEDTNANGRLDLSEDANGNGRLDPSEDLNGNGVLDVTEDTNGNGVLDTGEDTNGNGVLDIPTEDTDGDGVLDTGEDLNGNGTIDVIVEDANGNGVLDASEDTNGNGTLDPSEDTNGNGQLDGGFLLTNNQITRNTGDGVAVNSINNAIVNLTLIRNDIGDPLDHSTGNTGRGLSITADSGVTTANIGFLSNEDVNFNGVLDTGEDTNGNGVLDAADPLDANNFVANRAGGMFVDLSGTAVGNIVALNNTITGVGGGDLTFQVTGVGNGTSTGLPFSFINSSQSGININNLVWDLAPASLEFNTAGTGATLFSAQNGTGTTTGLTSVNGTVSPSFAVADQATALNLQYGNFQPANGVLDAGEDLNNNGVLDAGEDLPEQFDFNVGTATAGGVNTNLVGSQFIGSQITATFSSGQVLSGTMQAVAGNAAASEFVVNPNGNNIGTGPGVELRVSQNAVLNNPTLVGNNIQFNGGSGFTATATEDGQINNLLLRNNTIQNNGTGLNEDFNGNRVLDPGEDVNNNGLLDFGGGGISLRTIAANSAQINGQILNNTLSGNIGPGISVTADSGAINVSQIDGNTLDGNSTSIVLSTFNNGTINTRVTNNTMDNSLSDGFVATANTGVITLDQFSGNTLNNAGGNGIVLSALNGGIIDIPSSEDVNGNGTLDAGEDVNGNGFLDVGLRNNLLNNPVGNGLFVTGTGGIFNLGTVSGLSVNRTVTGNGGIVIDVTDSVTTGQFLGNSLLGDPVNNPTGGVGFSLTATNGTFDVSIGGPNATDRNVIQSNRGAGIAILAQNTAVGTFRIDNNLIIGTADDANTATPFSGQGIYVGTRGQGALASATAILSDSVIQNNVIGDENNSTLANVGGGLLFEVGDQSVLSNLTIDGNLIANNGPNAGATVVNSNNIINGLTFVRRVDAVVDNVVISNNRIVDNGFDGIYLHAFGGNLDQLDFTIRGNDISRNNFDGINLRTEADATMFATITSNTIESNGFNGIEMTSFENSVADLEAQAGVWTKNTIRNNGAHGIEVSTISGIIDSFGFVTPLIIGQNGVDLADGQSLGNLISGNGQGGIEINAPGDIEINNNMISGNGANPTALANTDVNGTGGIDVNYIGATGGLSLNIRVVNNVIEGNTGDGFELVTARPASAFAIIPDVVTGVTMLGNSIRNNTARGVDVLNQGSAVTNIRIGDGSLIGGNDISGNGLEGIYIVNTSSLTQSQQTLSTVALDANGSLDAMADIVADIRGNRISGNNNAGLFNGAGIVVRAGTTNSAGPLNAGGFFGASTNADASGDIFNNPNRSGNGVGVNEGDTFFGNGRINARITDNVFEGNLGDDFFIESFVSTVAPPATAGTWNNTNDPTALTTFRRDPLARVNLVFRDNTGNSIDVANFGAFYNNAEGTFKSRLDNATPPGPFPQTGGATRQRNAQSIATRFGLNPPGGIFEYDGMGVSTFRVESDVDIAGFAAPVTDFNTGIINGVLFGEQPFVWDTSIAPGTFTFPNILFP